MKMKLSYDHKTATLVQDIFEMAAYSGRESSELRAFLEFVIQLVLVGYGGRKFYFEQADCAATAEEITLIAELFSHLGLGAIREGYYHGGAGGARGGQSSELLFGINKKNKKKGKIWGQIISKKGTHWTAKNSNEQQKGLGMAVLSSGEDWANRQLDRLAVTVWFGNINIFTQVVPMRDEKESVATMRNAIKLCNKWKKIWDTVTGGLGLTNGPGISWKWFVSVRLAEKNSSWSSASERIIHTAD